MPRSEIPIPRLPFAPKEYSQDYMADLVRALEYFMDQQNTAGHLNATNITLTDLPLADPDDPSTTATFRKGQLYRNVRNRVIIKD